MAVGSWLLAPVLLAVIIRPALCQWPTNIPGEGGGRIPPPTVCLLCYDAHADCRAPASKAGTGGIFSSQGSREPRSGSEVVRWMDGIFPSRNANHC